MTLYLTEQGLKLRREGRRLQAYRDGKLLKEFRLHDLKQIFVFGRVHFTAQAIQALLKYEIEVHFLTVSGVYLGRLIPPRGKNIDLRLAQFRNFEDPSARLKLAKSFIKGKISNQKIFLRRQNKKLNSERLAQAILTLRQKIKEIDAATDLDQLRGIEGQAAYVYFQVFGDLIQLKGLTFPGRIRRPPPDPINALLSLGYTLLCALMSGFVETSGLDVHLGFLHSPTYGRPSLALDVMEEWRPVIIDPLVVRVFNWGTIKPQDFTQEPWDDEEEFSSFRLTPAGLRKFLEQYRRRLEETATHPVLNKKFSYKDLIKHQIWHLGRVLKGEDDLYHPFILES